MSLNLVRLLAQRSTPARRWMDARVLDTPLLQLVRGVNGAIFGLEPLAVPISHHALVDCAFWYALQWMGGGVVEFETARRGAALAESALRLKNAPALVEQLVRSVNAAPAQFDLLRASVALGWFELVFRVARPPATNIRRIIEQPPEAAVAPLLAAVGDHELDELALLRADAASRWGDPIRGGCAFRPPSSPAADGHRSWVHRGVLNFLLEGSGDAHPVNASYLRVALAQLLLHPDSDEPLTTLGWYFLRYRAFRAVAAKTFLTVVGTGDPQRLRSEFRAAVVAT